jgi:hypothetical protein
MDDLPFDAFSRVRSGIDALAATAWDFAVICIVLAVIVALAIQALYEIGFRAFLNREFVTSWLRRRRRSVARTLEEQDMSGESLNSQFARELKFLSSSYLVPALGRGASTYALRPNQLCGQIAAGARAAIDELPNFPNADEHDIDDFMRSAALLTLSTHRPRDAVALARLRGAASRKLDEEEKMSLLEAAEGLSRRVDRGVDALQSYLTWAWARTDYFLALAGAGLLLGLLITLPKAQAPDTNTLAVAAVLAPVAALLTTPFRRVFERLAGNG